MVFTTHQISMIYLPSFFTELDYVSHLSSCMIVPYVLSIPFPFLVYVIPSTYTILSQTINIEMTLLKINLGLCLIL